MPKTHTESAIDKSFQVPVEDSWIQFCTPKEVFNSRARGAAVTRGREVEPFYVEKDTESQSKNVKKSDVAREVVVHNSEIVKISPSKIRAPKEKECEYNTMKYTVVLILRDVPCESFWARLNLSWQ